MINSQALLAPIAEALDVREVFGALSASVRPVLRHDLLVLTELDDRARTFRVVTYAGEPDSPAPEGPVALTAEESENRLLDYEIVRDTAEEIPPTTERNRLLLSTGMRSWLRVPVRLWGEVRGSLGFLDREPGRYAAEDVAELVDVDYEPAAAVVSLEQALASDTEPLHPGWRDNLFLDRVSGAGDIEAALRSADFVFEGTYEVHRHTAFPLEPRAYAAGMIALRPDRDGKIDRYEGVETIEQRYRENILDRHFPPPGTPTQPIEAGYMANAWMRVRHPDYDELRNMMDRIGETIRVRAR